MTMTDFYCCMGLGAALPVLAILFSVFTGKIGWPISLMLGCAGLAFLTVVIFNVPPMFHAVPFQSNEYNKGHVERAYDIDNSQEAIRTRRPLIHGSGNMGEMINITTPRLLEWREQNRRR